MVRKYIMPGSVMRISILLTQTNLILLAKCTQTRECAHGVCVVPSLSHLVAHGKLLQGEVPILQGLIRGNKGEIFVHHFKSPFIPWLCFSQERLSFQATNYLIIFIRLRYLLEAEVLLQVPDVLLIYENMPDVPLHDFKTSQIRTIGTDITEIGAQTQDRIQPRRDYKSL